MPIWLSLCVSKPAVRRAVYSASVVGTILILVNYGDALLHREIDHTRLFKMLFTMVVPYVVSTVSSVITIMEARPGEL